MNWKEKLEETVESHIDAMSNMEVGSKEYEAAAKPLTEMVGKLTEMEKVEAAREKMEADRLTESERNATEQARIETDKAKLKADTYDRIAKVVSTMVMFGVAAAVTIWGTIYSDNFDVDKIRSNEAGKFHVRNLLGFMKNI